MNSWIYSLDFLIVFEYHSVFRSHIFFSLISVLKLVFCLLFTLIFFLFVRVWFAPYTDGFLFFFPCHSHIFRIFTPQMSCICFMRLHCSSASGFIPLWPSALPPKRSSCHRRRKKDCEFQGHHGWDQRIPDDVMLLFVVDPPYCSHYSTSSLRWLEKGD